MSQSFKEFLVEYYTVTKKDDKDCDCDCDKKNKTSKNKKDKDKECECHHDELVDFLTKSTATQN